MLRFVAVIFVLVCGLLAYHFSLERGFVNPYPAMCDLVATKIFLQDAELKKWKKTCYHRSRLVTPYSPKKLILKDMNNVLALLKVSHLEVYDSSAVSSIWQGQSLETGIQSEFVDGELVIFNLHPKSPALEAGLRKGDVIQSINAEQPNPWEAQSESGSFLMRRGEREFSVKIQTRAVQRDESMKLEVLPGGRAVLQVPSFRAAFFAEEEIATLAEKLQPVQRLVIDLRGNAGGNFVAGLRFLSLFLCKSEEVGVLSKTRQKVGSVAEMPNDLRDEKQLEILDLHGEVVLRSFEVAGCYRSQVRVLVDGKSSSVAEMVAQALKELRQAPLLGSPSRGQLLVGVWYPLAGLGPGVQISIPEAIYLSHKRYRIEGKGVELDRVLYYDLPEMQAGTDSWVRKALD